MKISLSATKRTQTGKAVAVLREEGILPAVLYGAGVEAMTIQMPTKLFQKVFKEAGESTIVEIDIDGEKKQALIHDVSYDPISNEPQHVDFYAIQKGQKVEVEIPLEFVGEAPAVKAGANLVKVLHEITIEGDATALPHSLAVDISVLQNVDDQITAGHIALPNDMTLITGPEEVVALAAAAQVDEETEGVAPDMSAIGISEARGKKEEEN
jgi:large subunit ribosomal protein L25